MLDPKRLLVGSRSNFGAPRAVGVRSEGAFLLIDPTGSAVQSAEDRVERDPQLRHREMYLEIEHPAPGRHKVQNAPFKLSETPAENHLPSPLIGQHTREIVEGLLGNSHKELCAGFADGTFWPTKRERFPCVEEMLQ